MNLESWWTPGHWLVGSWTDLGEGCCIEATFLEYGNIGDLAACQERCRTFTDCGSVSHGWSGESSQWCNIQARFSCRTPLNLSHCGTGDERFGVHTFVYAELPSLEWVVQGGGSLRDTSSAVVLDEEGAAFVTGYFTDTATFGHFVLTSAGGYDIFTIKVSAGGNISWALRGGGALDDKGFAVAVDAESGVVYTAGEYKSETITFGSLVLGAGSSSSSDIFLAKVSAEGTVLWAAASGGSDSDKGYSLAVDLATSSIFVTGVFASAPATFAPDSILASAGGYDAFVLKLHASGTALWALRAGGSQYDYGESIAVDSAGDSVVAGSFFSTPASFGAFRLSSAGLRDAFVIKVSDAGSVLWVTHGMGSDSVQANGISVDSEDGAVATGAFMSTATFSSFTLTSSGVTDIFVMKISRNGAWDWVFHGGGRKTDRASAVATDGFGNVLVAGHMTDTATFGEQVLTSAGESDVLVLK
eukprot:gene4135-5113_t